MDHTDELAAGPVSAPHRLELRVAADPFWMSPLRALVTDVAARAEFDIDRVADLTLVVDEACALIIRLLAPDDVLVCRFVVTSDDIEIVVGGPAARPPQPGLLQTAFGWQVIAALADIAEPVQGDDMSFGVRVVVRRVSEPGDG